MAPVEIGVLGIVVLLVLLLLRVPVGISMIAAAALGGSLLTSPGLALGELGGNIIGIVQNHNLSVIPLLILTGAVLARAGVGADLYEALNALFGRGKSGAAAASVGSNFALAMVFGNDTPIGLALVFFAFLARESIGRMLLAGLFPALIAAVLFMLSAAIAAMIRQPKSGALDKGAPFPWKSLGSSLVVPAVLLIYAIGIYSGVFTPMQAAAICAFVSLLSALFSGRLRIRGLIVPLSDTVKATAAAFSIAYRQFGVWHFPDEELDTYVARELFHGSWCFACSDRRVFPAGLCVGWFDR
jgi:TRAP-type C4-dicarboxylate transport system permease large subunit